MPSGLSMCCGWSRTTQPRSASVAFGGSASSCVRCWLARLWPGQKHTGGTPVPLPGFARMRQLRLRSAVAERIIGQLKTPTTNDETDSFRQKPRRGLDSFCPRRPRDFFPCRQRAQGPCPLPRPARRHRAALRGHAVRLEAHGHRRFQRHGNTDHPGSPRLADDRRAGVQISGDVVGLGERRLARLFLELPVSAVPRGGNILRRSRRVVVAGFFSVARLDLYLRRRGRHGRLLPLRFHLVLVRVLPAFGKPGEMVFAGGGARRADGGFQAAVLHGGRAGGLFPAAESARLQAARPRGAGGRRRDLGNFIFVVDALHRFRPDRRGFSIR